jgi:hypothetical protein
MSREPIVLPVLGVILAAGVEPDDVMRAVDDELFPTALRTESVPFEFTDYYRKEMGADLTRFWCAAGGLAPASDLASHKLKSGTLEGRWRRHGDRRVNLDPGYISALHMVIATTKPLPQAVYLRDGVYGVVELVYRDGAFAALPWTYPDYREAAAERTFEPFRSHLLHLRRAAGK